MSTNTQPQMSREEYLLLHERESRIAPRSRAYEAMEAEFEVQGDDFDTLGLLKLEVIIVLEGIYQQVGDPEQPMTLYFDNTVVVDVMAATDHAIYKLNDDQEDWEDWLPRHAEVLAIGFAHELGWIPRATQELLDVVDREDLYLLD